MIKESVIKNLVSEKIYDDVLWEYNSDLIQIIKEKITDEKSVYNLKFDNLKEKYDIMIVIKGDDIQGYCNCPKGKQGLKCEHLVWALLKINEYEKTKKKQQKEQQTDNYKLNLLTNIANYKDNKDEIILKLFIKNYNENSINIELKAGVFEDKLYKIASIENFVNKIQKNESLDYGKDFASNNYKLSDKNNLLVDVLKYIILDLKNQRKSTSFETLDYKYFNMILNSLTNNFIEYQGEQYFITKKLTDIKMYITKEENLKVFVIASNDYNFINEEIVVNNKNKTIYLLEKKDNLKIELLNVLNDKDILDDKYEFVLNKKEEQNMLKNILPKIFNEFDINIDSKLNIEVIDEKLKTELYCYKNNKKIYIKPEFIYGDYKADEIYENKLIKRDTISEEQVIKELLNQGYEYDSSINEFYITYKRSQFLFLTKNLFDLKKKYTINIDDSLKNAILNFDANSISVSVNKNSKYDYFEIDFDAEDINTKEINDILNSIENNRSFHQLSNDKFIKLDDKKIYNQLLFLKDVIKDNTHKLNTYRVPKYKAILMQEEISNTFNKYKFNQSFINYVESIKLAKPIENKEYENKNYTLRDYQKEGVSWLSNLYEAKLGGLLADEMGLGKTIQVISFLQIKKITSAMIVVPKALLYNWENEFKKFAPDKEILLITGDKNKREQLISNITNNQIILTSYPSIVSDYKLYENKSFNTIVIDEAQYIKNPQTKTARCVKMLKGEYFIALTGTPIENNLLELWSIFDFILPGYLNDINSFNKKYKVKESIRNLEMLKKITGPFIKRRLKKEVLKELPEKIETVLYCELEEQQKIIYKEYVAKAKEEIEGYVKSGNYNKKSIEILSAITRLRQIAIDPYLFFENYKNKSSKIDAFEELIDEIVDNKGKVVVFSQYTKLLKKLNEILEQKEIKHFYLDGKTRPKQRLMDVEKFNKGNIPVYLVSLKAGGVGLNLTSATNIIIMDPWWNPAVENQAIDRSHRIGQKNKLQVHKLVTKQTIEEQIQKLKEDKSKLVDQVLDLEQADITKIDTKELISLFVNE